MNKNKSFTERWQDKSAKDRANTLLWVWAIGLSIIVPFTAHEVEFITNSTIMQVLGMMVGFAFGFTEKVLNIFAWRALFWLVNTSLEKYASVPPTKEVK